MKKVVNVRVRNLATETVQSAALSLESVDDIEGGDGLSLGVLSVGDGVSDDTLEEGLQDTASLLVDHCWGWISDHLRHAGCKGPSREKSGWTYWPRYA